MPDVALDAILREAVSRKASDIHIKVGVPPYMRINGSLTPYGDTPSPREEVDRIITAVLDGDAAGQLKSKHEIDMAYTVAGVARFRCSIFRQRGMLEMVMRVVPYKIPSIDELGLPATLKHLALETRGMVLVTGITGSGKSTTIASMVQHLNESLPVHIVTIEDPIEFVYRDVKASISQREVGIDTESFHDALKYVLRQDPDVILLGEMRDRETAATALTAAETGHLVFSTLHTADAVQTIDRIIDMFPGDQQSQIRHAVAITMKATVSMRLLPKADGKGLAAAIEIMIVTPAIKALIAEGKLSEIRQLIAEGASQYGMQTFDQSILKLHKAGTITKETALEEATSPAELELAMRGITTGGISAQSFLKSSDDGYYKTKAKEFFDRARRLFQQDLVEDALREVRRALVDYPDYPEAKELLGKIEERTGKDSAKAQVQPFIKKGLELVAQDKIEEALAVFNQGLAMDPHNEQLLTMKRAAEDKGSRTRNTKPLLDRAQAGLAASDWAGARQALAELLELDPGSSDGYERLNDLIIGQARQQAQQELEMLTVQAEAASTEKKWFDAVALWNLVRELQPDHPKAMTRVGEAGGQIKGMGVPGIAAHAQQPWVPGVIQLFDRGLTAFLGGNTSGCLAEWRQIAARIPQAAELLGANVRKVEELHTQHVRYHLDRAKQLADSAEHGRALAQLRHALGVDPASTEARAMWETQSPVAGAALARHLADAEQWEKMDRLRAAVYCYERAFEIDPGREGLKQKVADGRARLVKIKDLHAAMDKRT